MPKPEEVGTVSRFTRKDHAGYVVDELGCPHGSTPVFECWACGALVFENLMDLHDEWHDKLESRNG